MNTTANHNSKLNTISEIITRAQGERKMTVNSLITDSI